MVLWDSAEKTIPTNKTTAIVILSTIAEEWLHIQSVPQFLKCWLAKNLRKYICNVVCKCNPLKVKYFVGNFLRNKWYFRSMCFIDDWLRLRFP